MGISQLADPVGQVLAEARTLVEPVHRAAIDRLPAPVRHLVGYHVGWWDALGRSGSHSGKSVRPALVLAAARAVGAEPRAVVDEAVAVELVHDFSLLHDDIMDGDLMRRHRPTAWALFGVNDALLAGDMLLALAADLLADKGGTKVLTSTVLRLCAGQSTDLAFEQRCDVGLDECVAMAAGKTAALMACACELGARTGGATAEQAGLLARFGHHIGLAFQLVDDLLGIWGDPGVTGKAAHSDLANRKKSLPVVAALTSGTGAGERLARLYHHGTGHDTDGPAALAELANLVEQAGGRRWAQQEADRHLGEGLSCLRQAVPDAGRTHALTALAQLITRRDH